MTHGNMNVAVILAGGTGKRLGAEMPKQFLTVAGKTIIEHTITAFHSHPGIDEIAIVIHRDYVEDVKKIVDNNDFHKVKRILLGGKERYDSSMAAIKAYQDTSDVNLLIHDAARPLVSHRIISDCIAALQHHHAVDVVINTTDTIIRAASDNTIAETLDRSLLRNVQTPQAFKLETIRKAYLLALQDPNMKATDDCGVVSHYLPEEKVYLVEGDACNIKLTYKEDLSLIERYLLKNI